MQLLSTISAAIVATAAMVLVIAEQEVHIKLYVSRDKFYVTPIGQQCYYNSCVDPSIYPCKNGACLRSNYTYGICTDKPEEMEIVEQNIKNVTLKCPYPNPYNPKSER